MRFLGLILAAACAVPRPAAAQALTGAMIGTVKDTQGGVLPGAIVRVSSPALIGGSDAVATDNEGRFRFPALQPGTYALDVHLDGFSPFHEEAIVIRVNATLERVPVLTLAALTASVVVEGGSRMDARDPGVAARFGPSEIGAIPTRRVSMFDFIRSAPGVSPTSPSSAVTTTVSAFGSGVNENQFLIDGTNFTCPCNGVARSEPGVDFIQEVHVQSTGTSAEFGNLQGAVVNIVTRQGSERFLYDASYYAQPSFLTDEGNGYARVRYRDLASTLGGPAVHDRVWFFAGYQYLRDYDPQPGTDPANPRRYEQNKLFGKLTWRLTPRLQMMQSVHDEHWVNPETPTVTKPFDTTLRAHATVPAITFANVTHILSDRTLWDARAGRFVYTRADDPSSGDFDRIGTTDSVRGIARDAPTVFSALTLIRTTAKATLSRYMTAAAGEHQWKIGGQFERAEHRSPSMIPGGVRFVEAGGQPSQSISSTPSNSGGVALTASAFASDAMTVGGRVTINAGVRFDRSEAISQDLPALDARGNETTATIAGLGPLYVWNVLSPRLGVTAKLTSDGHSILRASYGRFSQGVLTGEIGLFHPGVTPVTTTAYEASTGGYTRVLSTVDPRSNLELDRHTRAPHTDESSIGVDHEIGSRLSVAIAYVRKRGGDFIGWSDVGGVYVEGTRTVGGVVLPVFDLANALSARRYLLTNQDAYSMTYDGLVMVVEKRRSHGWQALGSYTFSRVSGLQPSSGTNAAGTQVSTVAPPPVPSGLTFGRDPNDLTNAGGRLPNDRPQMFRAMASADVPRTGLVVAVNLQYFDGKPWAATALVPLTQNNAQRVLLEPRGSRRLSSQMLLNLRVSKSLEMRGIGQVELMVDVLNALNDSAEESISTDVLAAKNFGQPASFIDPRRAMISAKVNLGR